MSHDQDVELDAVVAARRAAEAHLAAAVRAELAARYRRNRAAIELLVDQATEEGVFTPWQRELLQRQLDAQALRLTGGLVAV